MRAFLLDLVTSLAPMLKVVLDTVHEHLTLWLNTYL